MTNSDELNKKMKQIEEELGQRKGALFNELIRLAVSGQPCDVTFSSSKPFLDVKVEPDFVNVLIYSADSKKRGEMLSDIKLMKEGKMAGSTNIEDIWTINPMPEGGIPKEKLDGIDLEEVERGMGQQGEILRRMIKETYHCKNKEEEDYFLRRFIAS